MLDLYAPVCRHLTMPLWAWWEKSDYLRHWRRLKEFQYLPEPIVRRHQWERLQQQVTRAYAQSPFYRRFYGEAGFHPEQLRSWADVDKIPLLPKERVKQDWRLFLPPGCNERDLFFGKTSGSTGKPLEFAIDQPAAQVQRAAALLTNEWGGYRPGERIFSLFGRSTTEVQTSAWRQWLRRTALDRYTNLCTLDLDDASMLVFYQALRRARRPFLYGYAHALHLFAVFLEKKGLAQVQAAGVVSGGMPLHDWQRDTIERALQCKVLNRYGCEELGTIACECPEQNGLHIQAYSKLVEITDRDGHPLPAGETGYLIVTDFDNAAMPFIRYRIEDLGTLADRRCACGRLWPLLERLAGRESDFIRTPEGKMVSGISLTDNFGASIPGVFQLQLVQDRLDHILVRIVKAGDFGERSLEAVARLTREYFGPRMRFTCEFVPAIPLEASGKSRFVLSRLGEESRGRNEVAGVSAVR